MVWCRNNCSYPGCQCAAGHGQGVIHIAGPVIDTRKCMVVAIDHRSVPKGKVKVPGSVTACIYLSPCCLLVPMAPGTGKSGIGLGLECGFKCSKNFPGTSYFTRILLVFSTSPMHHKTWCLPLG